LIHRAGNHPMPENHTNIPGETAMREKRYPHSLELLLVFGLFFLSNIPVLFQIIWLYPRFIPIECVLWLVFAVLCLWGLYRLGMVPVFIAQLRQNWIIIPFLIFSGLSIFWSVYWQISLYRWLVLLSTLIAGGYIGLRYDLKRIVELLSIFGIAILGMSLLVVLFLPNIGIMNYFIIQGAWKGAYWHKNHMGLIAVLINIIFLLNLVDALGARRKSMFLWLPLYAISLLFVYQTDSVASYMTVIFLHGIIVLALFFLKYGHRIRKVHYLLLGAGGILGALVLFLNMDFVFGIFGRNSTLTGRLPMWSYLFNAYLSKRLLGGFGFNAFWYLRDHRIAIQNVTGYPDQVIISDNGFIDILVNTGYTGLVLFLLFYLCIWWRSAQMGAKAKDLTGVFPLIFMSYTLLANITWSLIFENENFIMLLMIAILFCTSSLSPGRHSDAMVSTRPKESIPGG
jgi:exopolysaccharide production protein ExoQ